MIQTFLSEKENKLKIFADNKALFNLYHIQIFHFPKMTNVMIKYSEAILRSS